MDITKDIHSVTYFRNHSGEFLQQLKETGRPIVLTINGKASLVVQDAVAYQHLLDLAADASVKEGNRQAREDIAAGHTRSAEDVFSELRAEYEIPR